MVAISRVYRVKRPRMLVSGCSSGTGTKSCSSCGTKSWVRVVVTVLVSGYRGSTTAESTSSCWTNARVRTVSAMWMTTVLVGPRSGSASTDSRASHWPNSRVRMVGVVQVFFRHRRIPIVA